MAVVDCFWDEHSEATTSPPRPAEVGILYDPTLCLDDELGLSGVARGTPRGPGVCIVCIYHEVIGHGSWADIRRKMWRRELPKHPSGGVADSVR